MTGDASSRGSGADATVDAWVTAARHLPALGADPCPGDVVAVRGLARQLGCLAADTEDLCRRLEAWPDGSWGGMAATAARDSLHLLVTALRGLPASFDRAAGELVGWAGELETLQDEADVLEARARAACSRLGAAVVPEATATAGAELQTAREQAVELHDRYGAAAARRAGTLDDAAPVADPLAAAGAALWDSATDRLDTLVRESASPIDTAAEALDAASAACGAAAALSALVPGLQVGAAGLASAAVVTAEGSLATRALLAAGAQGRVSDVWLAAVPAGLGRAVRSTRRTAMDDLAVDVLTVEGAIQPTEPPPTGASWQVPAGASPRLTATAAPDPWAVPHFAGTAVVRTDAPLPAGGRYHDPPRALPTPAPPTGTRPTTRPTSLSTSQSTSPPGRPSHGTSATPELAGPAEPPRVEPSPRPGDAPSPPRPPGVTMPP